jgi:hypothetical protein
VSAWWNCRSSLFLLFRLIFFSSWVFHTFCGRLDARSTYPAFFLRYCVHHSFAVNIAQPARIRMRCSRRVFLAFSVYCWWASQTSKIDQTTTLLGLKYAEKW